MRWIKSVMMQVEPMRSTNGARVRLLDERMVCRLLLLLLLFGLRIEDTDRRVTSALRYD